MRLLHIQSAHSLESADMKLYPCKSSLGKPLSLSPGEVGMNQTWINSHDQTQSLIHISLMLSFTACSFPAKCGCRSETEPLPR